MSVAQGKTLIERDSLIGKRIAKMDAPEKASGKTRYVHDIDLPGQLHGKILRSARVHARILRIEEDDRKVGLTLRGVTQPSKEEIAELEAAAAPAAVAATESAEEAQAAETTDAE